MKAIYLNTELARPIGIVNGTDVNMKRKPRTRGGASDCIVTYADGSQKIMAAHTSRNTPERAKAVKLSKELAEVDRLNKFDRHHSYTAANLAPIGNVE